jgi:hypothetical protein
MKKRSTTTYRALTNVRKYFPQVTKVHDADTSVILEVSKHDSDKARRKDHNNCAMAQAVKRQFKADGVIVALKTAYVVKNGTATRYTLPESVSREVVSFDRQAGFAPGEYELSKPSSCAKIGSQYHWKAKKHTKSTATKRFRHETTDIRSVLGSDKVR